MLPRSKADALSPDAAAAAVVPPGPAAAGAAGAREGEARARAELEEVAGRASALDSTVSRLTAEVQVARARLEAAAEAARAQSEANMELAPQCQALEEAQMDMDTTMTAAERAATVAARLSGTMPRSATSQPIRRSRFSRKKRLEL